jgi:tetratricopeptide (TPR) repeat protein
MRKHVLLLLLLGLLTGCGREEALLNNQGNEAFGRSSFGEALNAYSQATQKAPALAEPHYNAANTLYRVGSVEEALGQLQEALVNADAALTVKSFYNLGNLFFNVQEYQLAIEAYKEVLRATPGDIDAKYNLELALLQLQRQQQQQQQQQNDQQQQPQQPQEDQPQNNEDADLPDGDQGPDASTGGSDQTQSQTSGGNPENRFTEQQARQLLDALGQNTQTLQERLQRRFAPAGRPEKDW